MTNLSGGIILNQSQGAIWGLLDVPSDDDPGIRAEELQACTETASSTAHPAPSNLVEQIASFLFESLPETYSFFCLTYHQNYHGNEERVSIQILVLAPESGEIPSLASELCDVAATLQQALDSVLQSTLRREYEPMISSSNPGTQTSHKPSLSKRQAAKQRYGGLTTRERQVAEQIARGKSNRDIADELFIRLKTVEAHVTNILSKLGFASRAQVAGWAVAKGLANAPKDLATLIKENSEHSWAV